MKPTSDFPDPKANGDRPHPHQRHGLLKASGANESGIRLSDIEQESGRAKSKIALPPVFKWVVSYAAVAALALAQLGYTMVMAVESTFGIGRDSLLTDWPHIVGLGAPLLLIGVSRISDMLASSSFYLTVIRESAVPFAVLAAISLSVLRFRNTCQSLVQRWGGLVTPEGRKLLASFGVVALGTFGVFPALLALLLVLLFPAIGSPAFGLEGAQSYLYETVIKPENCLPVYKLAERRLRHVASMPHAAGTAVPCIVVTRKEGPREFGRLVLSGSDYVVLYNPNNGVTRKVPTGDAVIEAVASLDEPDQHSVENDACAADNAMK